MHFNRILFISLSLYFFLDSGGFDLCFDLQISQVDEAALQLAPQYPSNAVCARVALAVSPSISSLLQLCQHLCSASCLSALFPPITRLASDGYE